MNDFNERDNETENIEQDIEREYELADGEEVISVDLEENSPDDESSSYGKKADAKKPFADALEWVSSVVYAVAAMLVLNLFFFRSLTVSGDSMKNTLLDGDKVILANFCYSPSNGDIVVVQANRLRNKNTGMYGEPIIKRVIATEGETVCIDFTTGEVLVNGELIEEDYIKDLTHLRYHGWMESGVVYTVPENCIFVMGDNRNVSNDSRNLIDVGFIDESLVMGKAILRFSPIKEFKWL